MQLVNRVWDEVMTAEGGVDSALPPVLLPRNKYRWAYNTTMRNGYPTHRPGFRQQTLQFSGGDQATFEDGRFQGASTYLSDSGKTYLVCSTGGKLWRIDPDGGFPVINISIPGDYNSNKIRKSWFCQAEKFLIVQDGSSRALIYDGATTRRSVYPFEIPTGTRMAYGLGRVWVARGFQFVAGDLVYGSSGTPAYSYRDSVVKFTENTYLNGGGEFVVPLRTGEITGLIFPTQQDSATGDGELKVFTKQAIFTVSVPADRTQWQNLSQPVQRVSVLNYGTTSQESMAIVNGDIFYRAQDGVRSYIVAQRQTNQWGSTPLSREMKRALDWDSSKLLDYASAVVFDNRLLMTCWPRYSFAQGVWHEGLMALDFDMVSGMTQKLPPAWEGAWTGMRVLQLVKGNFNGRERCFAFCLDAEDDVVLWEITKTDRFDNIDDPITWEVETGALNAGQLKQLLVLDGGEIFLEDIAGTVTWDMDYAPDQHACWYDWANGTKCATFQNCSPQGSPDCAPFRNFRTQFRAPIRMPEPEAQCNPQGETFSNFGREFRVKLRIQGHAKLSGLRLRFRPAADHPYNPRCSSDETCISLECCSDNVPML